MEIRWRVNDWERTQEVAEGCNPIRVPVGEGEVIRRAEGEIRLPAARKMFFNGFQAWTHCPEYGPSDRIRELHGLPKPVGRLFSLDRLGDYHFVRYPGRKGCLHGVSYCYFRDGERYRLLASLDEEPGYTLFFYDTEQEILKLKRDCLGCFAAGSAFPVFDLFYAEGTEEEVFGKWFDALKLRNDPPAIKGYSSWYSHYQRINEERIRADLAGARKVFDPGDLFQIDDGWEPFVGDWETEDRKKFPHGLKPPVREIHEAGFRAGLWIAPFVCEKRSALYREHPDWLLRHRGKPWKAGSNWSGDYALDIDHPEVVSYLTRVFRKVFDEWGFDFVKLDFLYAAAPFATGDHGDPGDGPYSESRAGRMIRALRFLRELCGEKLILGCGVPLMPAFGLADYCRIGCDVSLNWDGIPFSRILHRERVSTRQSLNNTIFRRQLNRRAFGSDPDVFFLRDKGVSFSEEEKMYLAAVDVLFGSVWLTSDNPNDWDAAKTAQYWELFRLRKATDVRIDPDTLSVSYKLDGEKHILKYPHSG